MTIMHIIYNPQLNSVCIHVHVCIMHLYMCASVYVCTSACVYVCKCTCVHMYMCTWGDQKSVLGTCLCSSPAYIFETGFLTGPGAHRLDRLASWQESRISRVPPAPRNRLQMCATMPSFYVAAGNLNSVPQICIASTLPNAVSPAPRFLYIVLKIWPTSVHISSFSLKRP